MIDLSLFLIKDILLEDIRKLAQQKKNARKDKFLANLPKDENISNIEDVIGKLSFSFKYFDNSQEAGQGFKDWTDKQKQELLKKVRFIGLTNEVELVD